MNPDPRPHRPRKRFGQHFLRDSGVVERIVAAIRPLPGDRLVEIGPGLGALTRPLLDAAGELDAVELDRDLLEPLRARCAGSGVLRIHCADALAFANAIEVAMLEVQQAVPQRIAIHLSALHAARQAL